jgi:hypothetical protein
MKTLKALCATTVLALSLSIPAFAETAPGDNHTPGSPTPIESDTSTTAPGSDGATVVDGDISFWLLSDMLWTLASIY